MKKKYFLGFSVAEQSGITDEGIRFAYGLKQHICHDSVYFANQQNYSEPGQIKHFVSTLVSTDHQPLRTCG